MKLFPPDQQEHLYQLEGEMGLSKPVLFCLYKDDREGKWRVQAVSKTSSSFENRRDMPAAWRGLRDEKLSEVSGIPGVWMFTRYFSCRAYNPSVHPF